MAEHSMQRLTSKEAEIAAYALGYAREAAADKMHPNYGLRRTPNLDEDNELLKLVNFFDGAEFGFMVEAGVMEEGLYLDCAGDQYSSEGLAEGVKYAAGIRPAHPLIDKAIREFIVAVDNKEIEGVDSSDRLLKSRVMRRSTTEPPVFVPKFFGHVD